jgi:hypothetical protein
MPTQILTVGTGAADSSDVVVADGAELTVALNDAAGPSAAGDGGTVYVKLKDPAGQYFTVDVLGAEKPALVIGSGTWRFTRFGSASCGVFSA